MQKSKMAVWGGLKIAVKRSQVVGCEMPTARVPTGYHLTFKLLFQLKSTLGCHFSWKLASLRVIFLFVFV